MTQDILIRGSIGPAEAAEVLALADAAEAHDGVGPLSEDARLHVRYGGDPAAVNVLLRRGRMLAAFAHLGPTPAGAARSGELTVHPAYRGQGLGMTLARVLVDEAGTQPFALWAHGDLPAAARLAAHAGFTRARALWQMHRDLRGHLDGPHPPAGVSMRPFVPGQDEESWLRLNARAFEHHPEQGRWTRDDLDRREREPWFDPAGFLLAERDGHLAGFHWTKVHVPAPGSRPGASLLGEVYVIGVDPGERGSGLGRALTLAGLHHLRESGVPGVMLYVDESNAAAIRLYGSLGFTRASTDVMYQYAPPG